MTNGFPLYRLPQEALANVLRCVDSIDCFMFSLCSQRCKRTVAELNLKSSRFVVAFRELHIGMFIEFGDTSAVHVAVRPHARMSSVLDLEAAQDHRVSYYTTAREDYVEKNSEDEEPIDEDARMQQVVAEAAERVVLGELHRIDRWPQEQTFNFSTLSFKDWYDHCKEIYHLKRITTFLFREIPFRMDTQQIRRVMGGIKILIFLPLAQPPEALQQILAIRLPYGSIWLDTHSFFPNSLSRQKTLIENIEFASICGYEQVDEFSVVLDDLLVSNVRELVLEFPRISDTDLNRFVKCWMRGSNPHLNVLQIEYPCERVLSEPVIMKNIAHVKMSWHDLNEKLIQHDYFHHLEEEPTYIYNVSSFDGREATFTFGQTVHGPVCYFFVWN